MSLHCAVGAGTDSGMNKGLNLGQPVEVGCRRRKSKSKSKSKSATQVVSLEG